MARQCYRRQLEGARESRQALLVYEALQNLGDLQVQVGDYAQAADLYRQSLEASLEIEDRKWRARALNRLGSACLYLEDPAGALRHAGQGLENAREIDDPWEAWTALQILGRAYMHLGDRKAIETLKQLVALSARLNVRAENVALAELGSAYLMLGEDQRAIDAFEQSLARSRDNRDPEGQGLALERLGQAFFSSGKPLQAEKALRNALEVWEAHAGRPGKP